MTPLAHRAVSAEVDAVHVGRSFMRIPQQISCACTCFVKEHDIVTDGEEQNEVLRLGVVRTHAVQALYPSKDDHVDSHSKF